MKLSLIAWSLLRRLQRLKAHMHHEAPVKEHLPLIFALALALTMHLCFLGLLPDTPDQEQGQKLLRLELFPRLQNKQEADSVSGGSKGGNRKGRIESRQSKSSILQEQVLYRGRPAPKTVLTSRLENPDLQAALQSVKERIAGGWQKATPPEKGRVELRLVLSSQGEIISLWVLKLEGSPALADFVQDLLLGISPFPGLEGLQEEQMTLDCSFRVQQG